MCCGGDHVEVARGRDEDVGRLDDVVEAHDLVALHRRLQRADRVDLGHDDAGALPAQRLRAALADLAEAGDERELAAEHDVGRAAEAVRQRVAAAVDVVELRLRDGVVDVDRREQELALLGHHVEAVDARRRLLGDAAHVRREAGVAARIGGELLAQQAEHLAPLLGLRLGVEVGHAAGGRGVEALVQQHRGVAAIVDDQRRAGPVGPLERLRGAPPVLLERLALPGEHRDAARVLGRAAGLGAADDDRSCSVVLRREDVARDPAHVGAEQVERLDQHGGLHGHVQAAHDACTGQRGLPLVARAQCHEARHLLLGEADLVAAELGEPEVGDLVRLLARTVLQVERVGVGCDSHQGSLRFVVVFLSFEARGRTAVATNIAGPRAPGSTPASCQRSPIRPA